MNNFDLIPDTYTSLVLPLFHLIIRGKDNR